MSEQPKQPRRPSYENRSRLGLATPAIRPGMKGRVLLAGPSGAGKTYTALLIAMALREDTDHASVVMIDTEMDSGRTYADEFVLDDGSPAYMHLPWSAPYDVTDLSMTLGDVSGKYDVVIIDSHSHFWGGKGGVLDVAGGRFTGWAEARPMHADMIQAILTCDAHVILCTRMVQEHVQEQSSTGKWEVRKLGMKVKQDQELEYEVNVALEIDMSHTLHVSKSRTRAVPVGSEFLPGQAEKFAGEYREWLAGGEPAATKEQIDQLREVLNRIDDPPTRQQAKRDFVNVFGQPHLLLQSRVKEAAEWVADKLIGGNETSDRAPDEEPQDRTGPGENEGQNGQAEPDIPAAPDVPRETSGAKDLPSSPSAPTKDVDLPPLTVAEQVKAMRPAKVMKELVDFMVEEIPTKPSEQKALLVHCYENRVVCDECGKPQVSRRRDEEACECPI